MPCCVDHRWSLVHIHCPIFLLNVYPLALLLVEVNELPAFRLILEDAWQSFDRLLQNEVGCFPRAVKINHISMVDRIAKQDELLVVDHFRVLTESSIGNIFSPAIKLNSASREH